jgi:hypothetical protein
MLLTYLGGVGVYLESEAGHLTILRFFVVFLNPSSHAGIVPEVNPHPFQFAIMKSSTLYGLG